MTEAVVDLLSSPAWVVLVLTGGVVLVWVSARAARSIVLLTVVLASPLFVDIGTADLPIRYLIRGALREPGITIHVGAFVLPGAFLIMMLRRLTRREFRPVANQVAVGGLIGMLTLSFLVGQAVHGSTLSIAYYAQTVIPILAFYVGSQYDGPPERFSRSLVLTAAFTAILVLGAVALGIASGASFRGLADRMAAAIPQFRSYLPGVLALSVAFAVTMTRRRPGWGLAVLAVHLLLLPFLWSRAGMAMIFLAAVVAAGAPALSRVPRWLRDGRRDLRLVILGGLVLLPAVAAVGFSVSGGLVADRLAASTAQGDQRRVELALEAVDHVVANPIVGRTFRPEWDVTSGGVPVTTTRLFGSHNQYLDYALRGGVLAAALFVYILVRSLWATTRQLMRSPEADPFHATLLAVLIAALFGNFFQLYFIQSYSGSLLWLALGISARLASQTHQPDPELTHRHDARARPYATTGTVDGG